MKRSMIATMDRLEIEEGMKELVRHLWKHNYRTTNSCEGHGQKKAYVVFTGGDGWFEKNAPYYGLENLPNSSCCEPRPSKICCRKCGAGINGNSVYRGLLVQNPFSAGF